MTAFGLLVLAIGAALGGTSADSNLARLLLFGLAIAVLLAIFFSYLLAADLTRPLRAIAAGDCVTLVREEPVPTLVADDTEPPPGPSLRSNTWVSKPSPLMRGKCGW